MTTAMGARDSRDSALVESERLRREAEIKTELLKDVAGLDLAVEGCLFFLNGEEGHRIAGLSDLRLSPSAARFIETA